VLFQAIDARIRDDARLAHIDEHATVSELLDVHMGIIADG
jgi:hypothetical protein